MEGKKRKLGTIKFGNAKSKKKESLPKKILSAEERKRRKESLYRIPTSEELTELRENENLYKNNLFRMQVKYLLEETCLSDKKEKRINDTLHSLNSFLKQLPSQEKALHISDNSCLPDDTFLPLPSFIQKDRVRCKFQFFPPTDVKIVGSFLLKTLIKSASCIDIAVEIPKDCLQPRDLLNFRYHFKRASYLTWIAFSLKNWEYTDTVSFISGIDPYMPTIQLKLKGKAGKKYFIRVLTKLPDEYFKFSLLSPLRSNVRLSWFNNTDPKEESTSDVEIPTPHYNSSILADMLHESHLKMIYAAMNECPGMKEAICLFKLWINQRSFKAVSVFNSFIGAMLMVYLLSIRSISLHMSSYQIFRIVLNYIASSNWCTKGLTLCKNDDEGDQSLIDFHAVFDVVFVDSSGHLNLCANVDKLTYEFIRHQAKLSLDILDDSTANGFDGLFIKCHDFMQSVDQLFKLTKLDGFRKHCLENEQNLIDYGGNWCALVPKIVTPIIEQGLGSRIHRLVWKPVEMSEWCISSPPSTVCHTSFWYGLHLNTEFSNNLVIMGPPADQPSAKEFSSFWGDKSELRRFQDGSINEAVLWPCGSSEEKTLISERIIKHLLSLHCSIPESSIIYYADAFNFILKSNTCSNNDVNLGCGSEESLHFLKNFHDLTKQILSLKDIPLKIKSIDGIDSSFRLTEPHTPSQYSTKNMYSEKPFQLPSMRKNGLLLPTHNAVIQFETCGKWPDDVDAIQHIKAAFHIKLAECIHAQLNMVAIPSPSFVDVTKNGYVFRISVGHYREMVLCNESDASGALKKEQESSAADLDIFIVKKPLHTSLIHSLNSRYHAFVLTTRLAKRWIASQMLSGYLTDEATELIVASIFISPIATGPPNSHMCGFLRFLNLLAKFDWKNEPLIVNLNDEITADNIHCIRENFTSNRARYPPMFISTTYSKDISIWTKDNPSQQVLLRLSLLADAALKLCSTDPSKLSKDVVKQMFRPSLHDFNVIIDLNKSYVPLHYMSIDSSDSIKDSGGLKEGVSCSSLPVVDFNPPQIYLDELHDAFCDIALFFYDRYGGLKIGVVWKHGSLIPQNFKILNAQYKTIQKQKKNKSVPGLSVVPNLRAVISDFYVMGKGLVSNIEEK